MAKSKNNWDGSQWTTCLGVPWTCLSVPWTCPGVPWMAALTAALLLTAGCVRRTVSSSSSGILDPTPRGVPKQTSGSQASARKPMTPDESVRQTFEQQTRGAFNPLTDDRSIQLLRTRLRLNPQDVAARVQLAGIYERYRLYEEALEQYKQALNFVNQTPESAAGMNGQLAETAAEGLGRCAQAAGRGSEAVPVLAAFAKRTPSVGVWDELGMLYDAGGNLAAAEQAFRQAMAGQPGSDRLHNNLGYNLLLQKKLEAAEAEFRRAVELNPKSTTARNNLGTVLAQRGDMIEAFQQFRLAAADVATAHNNLAVVLLEQGRYERSRDELVKALSARYYFAPPIENFKLVQELLRQRAELFAAGGSLPLSNVRVPSSLAQLMDRIDLPVEQDRRLPGKEGNGESKVSEDGL